MSSNASSTVGFDFFEESGKKYLVHIKSVVKEKITSDAEQLELASNKVFDRIVDEIMLDCVTNVHRAMKLGYAELLFTKLIEDNTTNNMIPQLPQETEKDKKNENINCPICQRLIHGTKFARHLGNCMNGGRASSRIANQKIANNSKEGSYSVDDDFEEDYKVNKSKNTKRADGKKKKDNRRMKPYKTDSPKITKESKNGDNIPSHVLREDIQSPSKFTKEEGFIDSMDSRKNGDSDLWISPNKLMPLVNDDKVQFLSVRCGVRSDHTGKFCSRSLRCPVHTDAERADVRKMLASGETNNWDSMLEMEVNNNKNELGNFSSFINITSASPSTPRKKEKKRVNFAKDM